MSLLTNDISNGINHSAVIPDSTTGEFLFTVEKGKRLTFIIDNPGGSTYDLIFYFMSAVEATDAGVTRLKGVDTAGITDVSKVGSLITGVAEIGIEVTASTGTSIGIEVIEGKV